MTRNQGINKYYTEKYKSKSYSVGLKNLEGVSASIIVILISTDFYNATIAVLAVFMDIFGVYKINS